jgi:hypothetical protein
VGAVHDRFIDFAYIEQRRRYLVKEFGVGLYDFVPKRLE